MYTYKRRAQYHETDRMGIIHHSNYVKWMEEARVGFMDELGLGYKQMEETGIASPVVSISLEYKKPVHFDDTVEINIGVERYNGVALELKYEMINLSTGELCTKAASKHCFLSDEKIVSLKRVLPELDEKIINYAKKEK